MNYNDIQGYSAEEGYALFKASQRVAHRLKAGEITRDQAASEIRALGDDSDHTIDSFLLHSLDQKRLDSFREETGKIVD